MAHYHKFIKKDQDLDKKFRLVTAMHRNGPLPQVLKGQSSPVFLPFLEGLRLRPVCLGLKASKNWTGLQ
jgi:hypothetical protein